MASETLSFDIFANDRASATFRKLGLAASDASGDVRTLGDRLDKLGTKVATARVGLDGNKEANVELDKLDVKLIRLGEKVANPNIKTEGKIKALADIAAVDLAMDKLNKKFARPSLVNRLSLGALGRGAGPGIAGAGAAAGGGGALSGVPLLGALPTPVAIGAIAAAIAALPFIAQAAAGGIALALGGGFVAVGALAAMKLNKVKESFADLTKSANSSLKEIGRAFAPAMESIFRHLARLFEALVPVITMVAKPFKIFSDALLNAFMQPAVITSFKAIAKAFGDILKALAPQLPGDIKDIATGFTRIANAISKNPGAFAAMISFFFKATGFALSMVAALTSVANYIEKHFIPALMHIRKAWDDARHQTAVILDGMRHEVAHVWDQIFSNTIGTVIRLGHNIETQFNSIRHGIAGAFDDVRHTFATIGHGIAAAFDSVRHAQGQFDAFGKDIAAVRHVILAALGDLRHGIAIVFDAVRHIIAAAWDKIWHDTITKLDSLRHGVATVFDAVRHGIAAAWDRIWAETKIAVTTGLSNVVGWFKALPGRVLHALFGFGHSLYAEGHSAITEFLNGLKSIGGSIISWAKNFFGGLVKSIGKFLGMSPPHPGSAFWELGANMMRHLEAGIKSRAHKAVAAARGVAHQVANAGSGVQRWAPLVSRALRMEGLSPSLLGNVLYQMQTESGGNPNAINLTDSNAQHGDPSRGLMQTIMGTFQAYHWPGTSRNIYDPLANIAAALNYARHRYGPSLMSGGMGIGSGHGYDTGGWLPPGVSVAVNRTGQPERVTSPGQETAQMAVLLRIEKLLQAAPERTGGALGNALHGAARSARYQGMYSPRRA